MDIQSAAAFTGLAVWLVVFTYGAVDSCLNPEDRPKPRPRPRYPKDR